MSWSTLLARWPHLLTQLCGDFPHLEIDALRRFRGDRTKMVTYLAETHELTPPEASEALDHWLVYKAERLPALTAA